MIEQLKSLLHNAAHLRKSGEAAEAERLYKEAAAQAEADQAVERAEALAGLAQTRRDAGDRTGAAIYYAEAITLARAANDDRMLAYALRHAADVRSELHEYAVAFSHIDEAIRLYRALLTTEQPPTLDLANALRVSALNNERAACAAWHETRTLYAAVASGDTADDAGVRESAAHLHNLSEHHAAHCEAKS
ncbi:hypothetical protein [Terriglobus sp.]|uniref:hypothetical protein n=1 Tax=Terriglobus sp. TaxID=1889013 RepID=UPI003B00F280